VASTLATQTLAEFVAEKRRELERGAAINQSDRFGFWENVLVEGTRRAHRRIVERQVGDLAMMGSTIAAVLMPDSVAIVCHVGDSRVYLQRAEELRQLTRDHTLYSEVLARGVDLPEEQRIVFSNELMRALGGDNAEPEVSRLPVQPGDVFLLCTDGLYNALSSEQLALALKSGSAQEICERLVRQAYDQGATDNITTLVVRVLET
jgi:protein phosphatase